MGAEVTGKTKASFEKAVRKINKEKGYEKRFNAYPSSISSFTNIIYKNLYNLPTPPNLSTWWNFGSLLGLILVVQLSTGLFLSFHYTADSTVSFASISHISRDVYLGWLLRALHANGASFFFLCLYAHIGRGIYFGSYLFKVTWITGLIILLIVIATAFLGYVLPWGQISFWGATVITNLFRALPYVGSSLVTWLWGGFAVENPTLTRFYSFHFLVPFLLSGFMLLHIFALHQTGSNNPLGIRSRSDSVSFHILFTAKDVLGFTLLLWGLLFVVFFYPMFFIEAENFIPANPMVTPPHIVPEWYFLFAYAILRRVPSKLGGVFAMVSSLLILALLMFSHSQLIKGLAFYGPIKGFFWSLVSVFCLLTLAGVWPVEVPFLIVTRLFSIYYFGFFVLLGFARDLWDNLLS